MEQVFIIAISTVILFSIIKILETKYLDKSGEKKPLKLLVRDILIVFASAIAACFAYFMFQNQIRDFFNIVTETTTLNTATTQIFTDAPGF
jgi:nitrogen fixation/metabolism regulation signal transduction histidine kinase